MELREGATEVGDVVKDRVAEDQVEATVGERQPLGLSANRLDPEPERRGALGQGLEHPRRDVGRGRPLDQPELQQVEREIAGARADLERVAERARGLAPERLDQLRLHLGLADLAVVDTPLASYSAAAAS